MANRKTMGPIDLRDIISREDIKAYKELQTMIGDESYDSLTDMWQLKLDHEVEELLQKDRNHWSAFWTRFASTARLVITVVGAGILLVLCANGIQGCQRWQGALSNQQALVEAKYSQSMRDKGYISVQYHGIDEPIKGVPNVKLAALEVSEVSDRDSTTSTIRFVLNMPQPPTDYVYAVSCEVFKSHKVLTSGLFYTSPNECGLVRFEKTAPGASYGINWFNARVTLVPVGAVPKNK